MKYLKYFEKSFFPVQQYWEIDTREPYFQISLDKLKSEYNCTIDIDSIYSESAPPPSDYRDLIGQSLYIIKNIDPNEDYWNWVEDSDDLENFENPLKMENIRITQKDLNEYKIKEESKKFNI